MPELTGLLMLIEIAGPVFKCEDDKNIFFSRLYEMPNFEGVVGLGTSFHLTLTDIPGETVMVELQTVCDMWGTNFTVLSE
jgi:hypothetical protein